MTVLIQVTAGLAAITFINVEKVKVTVIMTRIVKMDWCVDKISVAKVFQMIWIVACNRLQL